MKLKLEIVLNEGKDQRIYACESEFFLNEY